METKFIRRNHIIETLKRPDEKSTFETFETNGRPSINKAKKKSHLLQNMNGGLGKGSLIIM
jgi:hypothetical protein